MTATEATAIMADEAERQGADPNGNDNSGIVRAIVTAQGLGFDAWFCVCCELADRNARRQVYDHQVHRAYELARIKIQEINHDRQRAEATRRARRDRQDAAHRDLPGDL